MKNLKKAIAFLMISFILFISSVTSVFASLVYTSSINCTSAGGTYNVSVSCSSTSWYASDNASWITVNKTSNYNIVVYVEGNTTPTTRTGNITVTGAGQSSTITVTQSAGQWDYMFHTGYMATHISSPYGWRGSEFHLGFDITTGSSGQINGYPVYNVTDGSIKYNGTFSDGVTTCVAVTEVDGYTVRYLHLGTRTSSPVGSIVSPNSLIGTVGDKGSSGSYHLHFDVNTIGTFNGGSLNSSNTINPVNFFPNINFN